ncbi:hypothetical protein GWA97_08635 [Flavobacterium sp. LaA7.5]|nr:hypothetical protein [Flavobacterium salilacus subsp. altitudinum]
MRKLLKLLIISLIAVSCNKAKDTVNKGGEAVGETATEFINGISEGVDNTIDSKIVISDELKNKGISIGKYYLKKDDSGNNNILVIYIITENDFNGTLTFKVFDKKDAEYGRQKIEVSGKAGEASYYDVVFDSRTDIESKSTIKIN